MIDLEIKESLDFNIQVTSKQKCKLTFKSAVSDSNVLCVKLTFKSAVSDSKVSSQIHYCLHLVLC